MIIITSTASGFSSYYMSNTFVSAFDSHFSPRHVQHHYSALLYIQFLVIMSL